MRARIIVVVGGLALFGIGSLLQWASAAAPDNALTLNGTSQYVRVGDGLANADKLNATSFTLEAWINRSGPGVGTVTGTGGFPNATAVPIIARGRGEAENSTVDMNYFFGIDAPSGKLVADYEEGPTNQVPPGTSAGLNHPITGATTITTGAWFHVAATFDAPSGTWKLYVNGRLDGTSVVGPNRAPRNDSIQDTAIGTALQSSGTAGGFFAGSIDEVRIWNVARTSEQIRDTKDDELTSGSGLIGRWGLDEGSGSSAADSTVAPLAGTLVGSPTWLTGQYAFPQDVSAPPAPTQVSAVAANGSVDLSWMASSGSDLAGYNIYRGTSPGVSTAGTPLNADPVPGVTTPGATTTYADATAANGTTYYYVVAAIDGSNNKAASTERSATPSATLSALRFDGTDDRVAFGPAPGLATPTFTLETWFMRTGTGVGQSTGTGGLASAIPLITKGRNEAEGSNVDMNYFLGIDTASGKLAVDFEEDVGGTGPAGQNHPLIAGTAVTFGVWHHAAATYDGETWNVYLDGQLDGTLLVSEPARGDSIQHAALGTAMTSTGAAGGFFQGVMDEPRIWNVARPQGDIQASMGLEVTSAPGLIGRWSLNEGSGASAFDSRGVTTGALTGANGLPTWVVGRSLTPAPTGPQALQLNGSSQYVTFGPAPGLATPTFTLETWFMKTGAGIGQQTGNGGLTSAVPLITKGRNQAEGSNVDMNYFLGIDTASGKLAVDFEEDVGGTGPAGQNHPLVAGTVVTSNVWHHAAATYDGETWKIYLDGRLDGTLFVGEPARGDSIQHAALGTAMDSNGAAGGFFQGVLDEARIWSVPRTGAQIRANKDTVTPGSTAGLLAQWHLDEGFGTGVADATGHGNTGTSNGGAHVAPYGFPTDSSAPVAPTGLAATPDDGTASLTWTLNSEPDVVGYDLYRSTGLPVSTLGTPLNGGDLISGPPYLDPGLTNGTQYHYALVAVDGADNRSSASAPASTTPVPADPVLVGAGDIADCDRTQDEATADLVSGIPGGVFTLGDNVYDNGLATEFANCYEPSWGAFKDRTRPTPGNHDYGNGSNDGSGYFDYFNAVTPGRAGDPALGYYSYDVGDWWHVVVLNSECYAFPVCDPAAQVQWLHDDLAAHTGRNVMATMHKPRWSSGNSRPGLSNLQPLWQELYDGGVEMLLVGHDHHYEVFAPQDDAGVVDPDFGVREFIVGTAGETLSGLATTEATNSEVRNNTTHGVMKLRLHQFSYDWQFIPIAGQAFTDSGTQAVHDAPPDTTAPTVSITDVAPAALTSDDVQTDVTWHANENGSYSVRVGGSSCADGTEVATGSYTTEPADVVTTVLASSLVDGDNTIRVCVTDAATNVGSATIVVPKNSTPPANALHFDGTNDLVTFGPSPSTLAATTFTLETWFRRTGEGVATSTGSDGVTDAIPLVTKGRAENDTPANLNMNYFLGIDQSSDVLVADFEDDNGGQNHPVSGTTPIANNEWHHAAATYDGTTWRLYLDGRLETKQPAGADGPESGSLQRAALGSALDSGGASAGFFAGDLDEVRIWNVARTGSLIRSSKDAELAGPHAGLLARWALNQASGTSAFDTSGHGVTGTVNGPAWVAGYDFPQDVSAPAAPTGLAATPDDGTASLTWTLNGESDVAGYDLYRSTSLPVSTSGTPLNGADLLTARPYLDTGLTNGTQYHYALVAVDGADNRSSASSPASTTPVPGDPVLVGAGDIADCDRTQDEATAALVSGIPGGVFTLGDNVYDNGLASEFANCYAPSWGAFKDRTRPTPGNHDYGNGSNDGSGYFDYFNDASTPDRAGDPAVGYYSYDVGDWWHVVVLNSECYSYPVCDPAAQLQWLRADLNAHAGRNVMATMHKPRWTSGTNRPGITNLQPLWQELYEHGVEMLFVGHDHHYERFAPQNGAGGLDTSFGVREFIVGTGGESVGGLGTVAPNSEVRDGATYGVMKLRLHQFSYDWQFIPIAGQTFTDSGTQAVHGVPNLRPVIDSVVISPASPVTNSTLSATVTSHDPNGDAVTLSRQWTRNGVDISGATGSTLNLATVGNGDKGDLIRLRVTGSDGGGAGTPLTSAPVTVQNTAPTATVTLNNNAPGTNTVLTATATKTDLDNDATSLTYVWKTNGTTRKTTAGTASLTDTFDLSQAGNGDAGDTITVEVTPSDGTASGTMVSRAVTVDAAPAPPGAPVVAVSLTSVNLDWPNSSEADLAGYNVYRAASSGGSYTKLNAALLTASTYADATAPTQATSYYRVTAVDTGGSESPPTAASAFRGIAFRAASSQKASGTSIAVARPAGVAANDVLLAVVQVRSAGAINTPAGWTFVRSDPNGTALRQAVFLHVAQASDPASFTWTFAGSQSATGIVLAYAGVNTGAPLDGSSLHTASSAAIPTTAFDTSAADAAVIGLYGTATNATVAPPGTLTERAEIASGGKAKSVLEAADSLQAAAGPTGAPSATAGAAAANIGQLVALRPANVPGPPDTQAPTAPSGLTATAVSATQVDLAWTASVDNVGVDHYVITRNGVELAAAPTGTAFSDTTVVPNTAYTYTVAAVDAATHVSPPSNPATVTPSSITFKGAGSAAAKNASSLSLPRPPGTQAGNVLIASIDVRGTTAVTAPSGWTLVQQDAFGVLTKRTYWRVAGAETGPYVFNFGSAQTTAGVIAAYAGVDTATPIDDHDFGTSTTASITAPSVDVVTLGSRVVSLVGVATNGSITPPAGWTERTEVTGGSGSTRVASELSDAARATGPTGAQTATTSKAGAGIAHLLVLRPAP